MAALPLLAQLEGRVPDRYLSRTSIRFGACPAALAGTGRNGPLVGAFAAAGPAHGAGEGMEPAVLVVEDDPIVAASVQALLRSAGYASAAYASARELLSAMLPDAVRCLVVDVRLPQGSGLDLQSELARRGDRTPIVFMTGHGDIPMSVRAMKAGAVDFLVKPFRDQDLLDAVAAALAVDKARREAVGSLSGLVARHGTLTPREKEVLELVSRGLLNKQVAGALGLSEVTVKLHRASLTRKMEARSFAELVRMAEALERGRKAR